MSPGSNALSTQHRSSNPLESPGSLNSSTLTSDDSGASHLSKAEDTTEAVTTTDTMDTTTMDTATMDTATMNIATLDTATQGGTHLTASTDFDEIMTGAADQGVITTSEDQDMADSKEANDALNATGAHEITASAGAPTIQNLVSPSSSDGTMGSSRQLDTQGTIATQNELILEKLAKRAGMHLISKSQVAEAKIHSSLENRVVPAKFDGNKYTIVVSITSDTPFTLNTRSNRIGEHSGRVVMVVEPTPLRTLDFLELPPEMRNIIYSLLFTRHGCGIHMNPGIEDEHASTRMRGVFDPKPGYREPYKFEDHLIEGTNLLATCSAIYNTARGVLYGFNDFEFSKSEDLTSFLEPMNKDTAAHIRCLNVGWLLPEEFKLTAKLLSKCKHLQKLHIKLDTPDLLVPPFSYTTEQEPEKVIPPFKAVLKQMYDDNKVGFFTRVTWTSPYPTRNLTPKQKNDEKAFSKKMKELILAQVMPPAKTPATSKVSEEKNEGAGSSTHDSNHGSA